MEFSRQYACTIRSLVGPSFPNIRDSGSGLNQQAPLMLTCDYNPAGCEIPFPLIGSLLDEILPENDCTVKLFYPLSLDLTYSNHRSGTDAILKYFANTGPYTGYRLCKINTPKGEVYYGSRGIILDKDFNVLCLVTYPINSSNVHSIRAISHMAPTVHLHPLVFIDDKSLNKALVKKALPFLLTESSVANVPIKANIVIDDSSKFIYRIVKPTQGQGGGLPSSKDYNEVLKRNIDEVMRQFVYDNIVG